MSDEHANCSYVYTICKKANKTKNFMHLISRWLSVCSAYNWISRQFTDIIQEPNAAAAIGKPSHAGQLIPHKQLWKTDLCPINSSIPMLLPSLLFNDTQYELIM